MTPFLDQAPRAVGSGYMVAFRFVGGRLDAIWEPRPPTLKGQMLRRYRQARTIFLKRASAELGCSIMCVEAL